MSSNEEQIYEEYEIYSGEAYIGNGLYIPVTVHLIKEVKDGR